MKARELTLNRSKENQRLLAKRRNVLLQRATGPERRIKELLDSLGERYLFQKGFLTKNSHFIVDFYLPKRRKLCLEVDGEYHEYQKNYDDARDYYLTNRRGFRVIRITNQQADAMDKDGLLRLIS